MAISEFTQQDYAVIARDYADLKEAARKRCANQGELDMVQKAFDFANEAHKGVRRRSGEPYILHPIAVAQIVVSNIGLGYKSICAALLHDVVEDTDYTVDDIRNIFGDKIASLVDGLTKIKTVLDNEDKAKQNSIQAENFKRILLTLNDDVRVVLIKLADRLHNCRTIEFMPEYKRDKILSETMFIFIPLAHRLGLYEVKSEMEDIWLRYKEPQAFNEISEKINRNINDKEKEIDEFIRPINEALTAAGFNFEIKKRVKTPYSIWHKMITKGITFEQVYDLYAVRIIFNPNSGSTESERDQCYHVFSIITGIYRYNSIYDTSKDPLHRAGIIQVEATSFTVSEPYKRYNIEPLIYKLANENERKILKEQFGISNFDINIIKLERMFIDKVFAAEFYYIRNMYKDTSKHLYDITILAKTKEIKELLQNKEELKQLISYKRQEESIRKGGIDANIKIKDFTYLNQDFNEELLKEFENMQNKYVLNDKYKIEISEVKNTLNEIINNKNIV